MNGWISIHRKMLENPIVCKDNDHLALWIYLLLNATHKERKVLFKGEERILKKGELITGRKKLASEINVSEDKVQRMLKLFEKAQQIAQQTSNKNRIVTVLNYSTYQGTAQKDAQQVHNKSTTNQQQMHNKCTQIKKESLNTLVPVATETLPYSEINDYLNERCNAKFRPTTNTSQKFIKARFNEGFKLEDFKIVIDKISNEWLNDDKMAKFLRPETLFGNKFEGYLNQQTFNNPKNVKEEIDDMMSKLAKYNNNDERIKIDYEKSGY